LADRRFVICIITLSHRGICMTGVACIISRKLIVAEGTGRRRLCQV
jgi:hypothetical protein